MRNTPKRICALVLVCALVILSVALTGCADKKDDGQLDILCTVFPIYDWVRNITGDAEGAQVSLLVKNGADLHSFQPSFADMAAIRDCDVLIYIGGESDKWVEDSLDEGTVAIKLSELDEVTLYQVSADSIAEGHSHEDGEDHHEAHDHSEGFDEHLWLSLKNATVVCEAVRDTLCELDSENAQTYSENTAAYIRELSELQGRMSEVAKTISEPLIFADRFPFVYLLEDHGIEYYAAFEGCTTDTDANFDTIIGLAQRLAASECGYVFVTEGFSARLVESVINESGVTAEKAVLDSMQSISENDIDDKSYTAIMEENISVLERIFS